MSIQIIIRVSAKIVRQVNLTSCFSQKKQISLSIDQRYIAAFDSNSYIKRPPLQLIEQARKLTIEIWFLSESPSGLLIYSDHVNSKKGYFTIYLQRRIIICNLMMGNKLISLR